MSNLAIWSVSLSIVLFCMNGRQFTAGAKLEVSSEAVFGPFTITTLSVDKCHMPGPVDKERSWINGVVARKTAEKEDLTGTIVVPQDIPSLSGQVEVNVLRDGAYKSLINMKYKDACSESLGVFIKKFMALGENCLVKKGNYTIESLDPNKIVRHLIGEKFLYAKILINLALYSEKGLVSCVKWNIESKPVHKKA